MLNDLAWVTFTILVPYLIAQCLLLALAIFWDRQDQPVFKPWVAVFNLVDRGRDGACRLRRADVDRALRMGRAVVLLAQEHCDRGMDRRHGNRSRPEHPATAPRGRRRGAGRRMSTSTAPSATLPDPSSGSALSRLLWNVRHHPKRELWFAWYVMLIFYNLYGVLFFVVTQVQPPPSPAWDTPTVVQWFGDHHLGLLAGFGVVFLISGMCGPMNALLAYSMRRMSVSRHLRLFVHDHVCAERTPGHAGDGRRDDRRRPASRQGSRVDPVALRLRVPLVQRNHGRVLDRFTGVDGGDPDRQEPRVSQVVRLPQPLQRVDRSRGGARVDVPSRRLRMERCDRMVDQHGGLRLLHGRLPHISAQDDPARGLRHRSIA